MIDINNKKEILIRAMKNVVTHDNYKYFAIITYQQSTYFVHESLAR